ncbi:hypothetical protein [Bradyrhizobium sp. 174]|uniref:hypothetical protein n=1 Tax=Bradyrhizobium sp. 174 TaxID=2782645 RepID=UPI001FF71EAE|nr:hypothetical protein [Bradyrhizobium sp. 174]MCK1577862.1 hypothetical protein [Bradyrhizobium sp. 174]
MAGRGYIKLYRSLFRHEFFRPAAFSEREAFTWMIAEAAWKPRQRRFGQFFVDLERGDLAASLRFLAETWDWSVGAVRGYLGRCEKEGMISTRSDKGVTVVTICNYDIYQGDDQADDTVDDNVSAQSQHSPSTAPAHGQHKTEEIKHSRKEEGEKDQGALGLLAELPAEGPLVPAVRKPTKRPRQEKIPIPPDWAAVGEDWQYAIERGFTSQTIPIEEEKFRLHFLKTGEKRPGWSLSWKSWIVKAHEFKAERAARAGAQTGGARPNRAETAAMGMLSDLKEEDFHGRPR